MLAVLALASLYAGWHALRAGLEVLRRLPRSNDDLVFF